MREIFLCMLACPFLCVHCGHAQTNTYADVHTRNHRHKHPRTLHEKNDSRSRFQACGKVCPSSTSFLWMIEVSPLTLNPKPCKPSPLNPKPKTLNPEP